MRCRCLRPCPALQSCRHAEGGCRGAEFCCNGNVVEDNELGKVIQLQGDQRKNVSIFLTGNKLASKDLIKASTRAPDHLEMPHELTLTLPTCCAGARLLSQVQPWLPPWLTSVPGHLQGPNLVAAALSTGLAVHALPPLSLPACHADKDNRLCRLARACALASVSAGCR